MRIQEIIDSLPVSLFLLVAIAIMILMIEIGYQRGKHSRNNSSKAQMAQVRAIMGASLGLLAFMLAFSFAIAQRHFDSRTDAYLMEVTAIDAAYRGTSLLDTKLGDEARQLLQDFVQLRRDTSDAEDRDELEEIIALVRKSEKLHDGLWQIADSAMQSPGDSIDDSLFTGAILEMIRAHDERLQHTMFNRIPPVIWATLIVMSFLSMVVMGYQAGLTGKRSMLATWTLAITFAVVLTLVADLDRPQMKLFKMNQTLMTELHNRINQ